MPLDVDIKKAAASALEQTHDRRIQILRLELLCLWMTQCNQWSEQQRGRCSCPMWRKLSKTISQTHMTPSPEKFKAYLFMEQVPHTCTLDAFLAVTFDKRLQYGVLIIVLPQGINNNPKFTKSFMIQVSDFMAAIARSAGLFNTHERRGQMSPPMRIIAALGSDAFDRNSKDGRFCCKAQNKKCRRCQSLRCNKLQVNHRKQCKQYLIPHYYWTMKVDRRQFRLSPRSASGSLKVDHNLRKMNLCQSNGMLRVIHTVTYFNNTFATFGFFYWSSLHVRQDGCDERP